MAVQKPTTELQEKVFKISLKRRYLKLIYNGLEGKRRLNIYNCFVSSDKHIIFEELLNELIKEVVENLTIKLIVIDENFKIEQLNLNTEIKKLLKKDFLIIENKSKDELKKEQKDKNNIDIDFYKKIQLFEKENLDSKIDERYNNRKPFSYVDIDLAKETRELLNNKQSKKNGIFDTTDLDTHYTQNAPANWPKDKDLPDEIKNILGPEYKKRVLEKSIDNNEGLFSKKEIKEKIGNGRAWPVPSLEKELIYFESYKDIQSILETYIQSITQLPFVLSKSKNFGGLGVYRHLHTNAAIAIKDDYSNVLYLEIYGTVLAVNGYDFTKREFEEHLSIKHANEGKTFIPDGPMVVQIKKATLANYSFPNIGVPLYL